MYFILDGIVTIGIDYSQNSFSGTYVHEISEDLGLHAHKILQSY